MSTTEEYGSIEQADAAGNGLPINGRPPPEDSVQNVRERKDEPFPFRNWVLAKLGEMESWLGGWAFPIIGFFMCFLYCYTFTAVYVGAWLQYSSAAGIINLVVFWFFGLLYIVSYIRASSADPGSVPDEWRQGPTGEYATDDAEFLENLKKDKKYWCLKCLHFKPPRTHHCRRCGRCVLKMDHHCVWINNCVGYYNHKLFFLCVVYSFILCALVLLACLICYINMVRGVHFSAFHIFIVVSATLVAGVQEAGLQWMLSFQLRLVRKNMTNVEHACCNGQRPGCYWNRGFWNNLAEVFGENVYLWWFPCLPRVFDKDVDGIYFEIPEDDAELSEEESTNPDEESGSTERSGKRGGEMEASVTSPFSEETPLLSG